MGDFLRFETMITPVLIQVLFWIAVVFCLVGGITMMVAGGTRPERLGGLLLVILGPLVARIYSEIFIVWFRMAEHLRRIDHNTQRS